MSYLDQLFDKKRVIQKSSITLNQNISISNPKKNLAWKMHNLNHQNFLGNIYLSGIDNLFLKKKIGKNKFSKSKIISSPLIFEDSIIFSDDKGTIFSIYQNGEVNPFILNEYYNI